MEYGLVYESFASVNLIEEAELVDSSRIRNWSHNRLCRSVHHVQNLELAFTFQAESFTHKFFKETVEQFPSLGINGTSE